METQPQTQTPSIAWYDGEEIHTLPWSVFFAFIIGLILGALIRSIGER